MKKVKKAKKTKITKKENTGFALIELVVILAMIIILAIIAAPSYSGYTSRVKAEVCHANCVTLMKEYDAYLASGNLKHSEALFQAFYEDYDGDICPCGGVITFEDEHVVCSIHSD